MLFVIALKTHTDIDIVRSWSFEKQLGWAYALNEIYGKDKEVMDNISSKMKSAKVAPRSLPTSTSVKSATPAISGGKRFVKIGKGKLKAEHI